MFLHYSPFWLKAFYPKFLWHMPTKDKVLYLTFDDGPIPEVTEFVLESLGKWNAKATFFCIGDNVRKHPDIFEKLVASGHSIGNHTFNHMNGWKSETDAYIANMLKCKDQLAMRTDLFRPPYGRIQKQQAKLLPENTKVVMWDVLSGDFSASISPEQCLSKSIQYSRPGSIVLFHDSIKASRNMEYTLPLFLKHFSNEGYLFKAIPMN